MPDTITIIADICEELNGNGFCHTPRVVPLEKFEFSKHKAQDSDVEGIATEYVFQEGPGVMGDDYSGTIAYPIGGQMLVLDFNS